MVCFCNDFLTSVNIIQCMKLDFIYNEIVLDDILVICIMYVICKILHVDVSAKPSYQYTYQGSNE